MATPFEPGKKLTFTIAAAPQRPAQMKTLRRLMRMQPKVQSGLKKLARRRKREDNQSHQRGGRQWVARVRTTKLTHIAPGESFTLTVTPQIVPDLRSVEKFLKVSSAK